MTQISVAIPDGMLKTAQKKAKQEGYRSVQEYMLQALRDKWFMDNLPKYERILDEVKAGKGYSMSTEEYRRYSGLLQKGSVKEADAFLKAHKLKK